jgi:HTH-type transcriptional regulator, quorum sensing regulator NprR
LRSTLLNHDKEQAQALTETLNNKWPYIPSIFQEIERDLLYTHFYLIQDEYETGISYYEKHVENQVYSLEKLPDQFKALYYDVLGQLSYHKQQHIMSKEYFLKQLEYTTTDIDKGRAYNNISLNYFELFNLNAALEYAQKSADIWEKKNDEYKLANVYLLMGVYCMERKHYDKAVKYLEQALALCQPKRHTELFAEMESKVLHNIGMIYKKTNQYERSLDYFYRSLEIKEGHRDRLLIMTYYHLFMVHDHLQQYADMQRIIDSAEMACQDELSHHVITAMKGKYHLRQKQHEQYETLMKKSIQYFYREEKWRLLYDLQLAEELCQYYEERGDHHRYNRYLSISIVVGTYINDISQPSI